MKICVFGAASNKIDKSYIKAVEELGELLGSHNHSLVFGAGANGLMGAAARGTKKSNGKIYGVVPSFFIDENIEGLFTDCTELILTETMRERKAKMEDMSDAFIIVPGGIGTFEEMFEIITLRQLGRHNKPIVIYNINGYYDNMQNLMEHSMREGFVREICSELYSLTNSAEETISSIENFRTIKWDPDKYKS